MRMYRPAAADRGDRAAFGFPPASGSKDASMTPDERGDLVLACARTLFVNGQATDQIAAAAERLARALGLRATLTARWGELLLRADGENGALLCHTAANPAGVHMGRVAATMRAMADIEAGRLAPDAAMRAIDAIARMQAAPTWLFALAAAASAAAFAVLYGAAHLVSIVLVAVSAGAGAVLRRRLAEASDNNFIQPFGAAILAGAIGAVAVRSDLSSSLRLVAVCPCMILVPGPHVLNGALDLIRGRINLGAARLLYARPQASCWRSRPGLLLEPGIAWRLPARRCAGASCSVVAGHRRGGRGGDLLLRLLLDATDHAALAGGGGDAGACAAMGCTRHIRLRRRHRCAHRLRHRRVGACSGFRAAPTCHLRPSALRPSCR